MKTSGILIAIEGIDGSGKTSLIYRVMKLLRKDGFKTKRIHEVEKAKITYEGRVILKSLRKERLSPEEESFNFLKIREFVARKFVNPAISKGYIVFMDRYYYSTAAYQGTRFKHRWLEILEEHRAKFRKPDLIVILEIDPIISLQRLNKRKSRTTFEKEKYLAQVQDTYYKIIGRLQNNDILVLDASKNSEFLEQEVYTKISLIIREKL